MTEYLPSAPEPRDPEREPDDHRSGELFQDEVAPRALA